MRLERKIAWASLGGPAIGAFLWGTGGFGLAPPHWTYATAIVLGGAGAVISGGLWLHIAYAWFTETVAAPRRVQSPLEVIFDPLNAGRKYWSIEQVKDETGNPTPHSYWEYRAAIKNVSNRTVRNVRVTVEAIGAMPT